MRSNARGKRRRPQPPRKHKRLTGVRLTELLGRKCSWQRTRATWNLAKHATKRSVAEKQPLACFGARTSARSLGLTPEGCLAARKNGFLDSQLFTRLRTSQRSGTKLCRPRLGDTFNATRHKPAACNLCIQTCGASCLRPNVQAQGRAACGASPGAQC